MREESGLPTGFQAYPSGTKVGIDEHGTDGKHGRRRKQRVFLSLNDMIRLDASLQEYRSSWLTICVE